MVLSIAIIGAGPAGCMLARLLQQSKHDISVTVFEAEASINFRSQGGTLDLHESTGQKALKAGGLFDEFLKYARYDGEAMKITDKKLLAYIKQGASKKGSTTGRPEIDRPKLRELLFNSLEQGTVQWSKKLISVSKDRTIHFADGTHQTGFDLIVGADGAWSKTRPLLTDVKPYYSGVGGHSFYIADAEQTEPELYDLVNRGSVFAFSDSKSIMAQQMGDGGINVATWSVRPVDWQTEYDCHDAAAAKAAARKEYADWDPRLLALIEKSEDHCVPRDLYMMPIGNTWEHFPGVTIIGDAAHVMTPFAGEGVNLAFEDSLKLSEAIISAAADPSTLDAKHAAFEQDMFRRQKATQQLTKDMMDAMLFTEGAPRKGIEEYVIRAVEGEMGPWVTNMLVRPICYAWFFVFKLIW